MAAALAVLSLGAAACGGEGGEACPPGDPQCDDPCAGGRCDLPEEPDELMCSYRRAGAFDTSRPAYLDGFLRWSCLDVDGVTEEDRGQEYCEAFALVDVPAGEGEGPAILGKNLGPDSSYGTTPVSLDLDDRAIIALEEDESAVVGQCVFSSWNSDIEMPVAGCEAGPDAAECPRVLGVPVQADPFRMTFDKNSDEAAEVLVEDCLLTEAEAGATDDPNDPLHDDFTRGCMLNAAINDTAFSKADSTICPVAMRLGECGCFPTSYDDGIDFPKLLSPSDRRGFPLGTWSGFVHGSEAESALPPGCRYVDLGDDSQTVVSCDLTASDVLNHAFDLRGRCADKYADRVVVHVEIPEAEIECFPSEAPGPYADRCGERPWVLGQAESP